MSLDRKQLVVVGVVVLLAGFLVLMTIVISGDRDTDIVSFVPIWFAAILPAIIAAQEQRKEEATQKQKRKQKREMTEADRYTMMNRLVDDLDEDELDYLEQRLAETDDDEYEAY